ncbi:MAG: TetR family transcriptional regulator [Actinobacteria bacterium]|nr:TetR family transcriptional regulator [Actinomycetota bacterium]
MSEPTNIVNIDGRDRRPWAVVSREKLLRAAIAEIADRGYEHARLVDIAARADMTVGASCLKHFESHGVTKTHRNIFNHKSPHC